MSKVDRMRNATHSDDCPHDVSACPSRLPSDGINLVGDTFQLWFTIMLFNWTQLQYKTSLFINQPIEDLIEGLYRIAVENTNEFFRQNCSVRKLLNLYF